MDKQVVHAHVTDVAGIPYEICQVLFADLPEEHWPRNREEVERYFQRKEEKDMRLMLRALSELIAYQASEDPKNAKQAKEMARQVSLLRKAILTMAKLTRAGTWSAKRWL